LEVRALVFFLLLAGPASAAAKAPRPRIPLVLGAPIAKLDDWGALKGKVVYVDFWATWCLPCVAGLPRANALVDALKGVPVVFLSITDEDPATVRAFLKKREIKSWVGVDESGASLRAFGVKSRPDGFLIGKDGAVLAHVAPDKLTEKAVRDAVAAPGNSPK
jgi:thiol-disulfide isomerase/thioredoxin